MLSDDSDDDDKLSRDEQDEQSGTGFFQVVKSVLAAGFGVQSGANRERDFTEGKASHFIVGGLIGTVVFVLLIVVLVKVLLANV